VDGSKFCFVLRINTIFNFSALRFLVQSFASLLRVTVAYFTNASVTRTEYGFDLLGFFFGHTDGALAQYKQAAAVRFAEQVLLQLCLVKENSTAVVALLVPVGYNL
jgi:hypothetical protein